MINIRSAARQLGKNTANKIENGFNKISEFSERHHAGLTYPNALLRKLGGKVAKNVGGDTAKILASLTERKTPDGFFLDRKLTLPGKAVALGVTTIGIGYNIANGIEESRTGQRDGRIHRATPSYREYMPQQDISAGASGDLVFAMHNNRHRGYL